MEPPPPPVPARYRPGRPREQMPRRWFVAEGEGALKKPSPVVPMATQSHRMVCVSERGLRRALQDFLRHDLVTPVPQSATGCCPVLRWPSRRQCRRGTAYPWAMTCACGSPALTAPLYLGCEAPPGTWGSGTSPSPGESWVLLMISCPPQGAAPPRFSCCPALGRSALPAACWAAGILP